MQHNSEKCREIFALLSEYLDLELPPEACAEIQAHLSGCAPCVEFVESLRKTVELCKGYEAHAMPRPLSDSVRAELQQACRRMLASR